MGVVEWLFDSLSEPATLSKYKLVNIFHFLLLQDETKEYGAALMFNLLLRQEGRKHAENVDNSLVVVLSLLDIENADVCDAKTT